MVVAIRAKKKKKRYTGVNGTVRGQLGGGAGPWRDTAPALVGRRALPPDHPQPCAVRQCRAEKRRCSGAYPPPSGKFGAGAHSSGRFWEEDEHIFGGISYNDLPIPADSYPSTGATPAARVGVCSAATLRRQPISYGNHRTARWPPAERVKQRRRARRANPSAISRKFENRLAVAGPPFAVSRSVRRDWATTRRARITTPLSDRWPHRLAGEEHASTSPPAGRRRSSPRRRDPSPANKRVLAS